MGKVTTAETAPIRIVGFALAAAATALAAEVVRRRLAGGPGAGGGLLGGVKGLAPRVDRHGRTADAPHRIPAKGWKDIAIRAFKEFKDDEIPMISAGVTFYTLLAIFPGVGAFAALYGLFADLDDVQAHIRSLSLLLPGGAITLIGEQMQHVAATSHGGLSLAFAAGLLVSIWSANGAVKAIITGLNIAYEEKETRGFLRRTATSLALTVGFLVFVMAAAALMALRGVVEARAGVAAGLGFALAGWAAVFVGLCLGLALLYRFGPSRDRVKWRWISWGSVLAALAWVLVSAAFSNYVAHFGRFDRTYGSLGAAVGFMTWTWLSAMVILFGGELNSEIEHQTARDTTVGPRKPLGLRGAAMADTVGEAQ